MKRRGPVDEVHFTLRGLTPMEWEAVFKVLARNDIDFDKYFAALIVKACQNLIEREAKK